MDDFSRQAPPRTAGEREIQEGYLDYQRATLLMKLEGLSDEALRRPMVASGLSLLGIVKHLAYAERWWFQNVFRGEGEDVWALCPDDDPNADFRIEPHESTAAIIDLYKGEVRQSRQIVAAASLDDHAINPSHGAKDCTLRWIITHMLAEVARHNGHADILREQIDGVTGD